MTQRTKRFSPIKVMSVGTAIYAIAAGAISLVYSFLGFWFCMVLMTTGELMLVPTASTSAANMSPVGMRGRYMSIYGLTWGIASGVSSPMGGYLRHLWTAIYLVRGSFDRAARSGLFFALRAPSPRSAISGKLGQII